MSKNQRKPTGSGPHPVRGWQGNTLCKTVLAHPPAFTPKIPSRAGTAALQAGSPCPGSPSLLQYVAFLMAEGFVFKQCAVTRRDEDEEGERGEGMQKNSNSRGQIRSRLHPFLHWEPLR